VPADLGGVEGELAVLEGLFAVELVEGELLAPVDDCKNVARCFRGCPGEAPDGRVDGVWTLYFDLLLAGLVADLDGAVEEAQGHELAVVGPGAGGDAAGYFGLGHGLVLEGPEAEVGDGAGEKHVGDGVEGERLNRLVVAIGETRR